MKILSENIKSLLRSYKKNTLNRNSITIWVKQYGAQYFFSVGEWYVQWTRRSDEEKNDVHIYLPIV